MYRPINDSSATQIGRFQKLQEVVSEEKDLARLAEQRLENIGVERPTLASYEDVQSWKNSLFSSWLSGYIHPVRPPCTPIAMNSVSILEELAKRDGVISRLVAQQLERARVF